MTALRRDMSIIIPSKTRPKFDDRLGVALNIIERGHQSSESIHDRVRTAVAIEDINHLKTFPMETQTSFLKQKMKPPIPTGNSKLTLPIATGLSV